MLFTCASTYPRLLGFLVLLTSLKEPSIVTLAPRILPRLHWISPHSSDVHGLKLAWWLLFPVSLFLLECRLQSLPGTHPAHKKPSERPCRVITVESVAETPGVLCLSSRKKCEKGQKAL